MNDNDSRIVYGARCTWWDSIDKIGVLPPGQSGHRIPCCPHCSGVLFEMPDEKTWFAGVDRHEAAGNPGYRAMIEWARGRCYSGIAALRSAYEVRGDA